LGGAGVVMRLGRDADLMMPLPLIISCSSKSDWFYQNGAAFLVLTYPGCPGKKAVKRM